MRYLISALFLLFSLSSGAAPSEAELETAKKELETYFSQLDGDWEGSIESKDYFSNDPDFVFRNKIRLRIKGDSVLVGTFRNGFWYKSGYEYKIIRHKTHALIYAFASDKGWVESFSFTVLLKDINSLTLLWNRSVSNFMVPPSESGSRGHFQGVTVLKRLGV
ncbi:hypothetical protein ACMXYV_09115 [Neptuniibacter sp. SY11_33]|uniref:hypothetical protein n=1 Tax=Neptuniibacter sp. SY11_33 TaxID=3398215 RepID=UPI0039F51CC7